MPDKDFTVTHARARTPITVRGKTLKEALENEGLDPTIWKEVQPQASEASPLSTEPPTDD